MLLNRRHFLTYLGIGTYGMMREFSVLGAKFPLPRRPSRPPVFFKPIRASMEDKLILPRGYRYNVVCQWDTPLGTNGPFGAEKFGYDNDFLAFLPLDALKGGKNRKEGLLWVNHENVVPMFVSQHLGGGKSRQQIQKEKLAVGGSIIEVRKEKDQWKLKPGSRFTKRFTALYPKIPLSGPTSEIIPEATGTLANCGGGVTPWHTILSCEENYQNFNRSVKGFSWGDWDEEKINENEYGWVVEIDPFGELPPMKHSSLGRCAHENAALGIGTSGRLVIYLADDADDQYFYKFVSSEKFNPKASREDQRKLLTSGVLYVSNFATGKWLPVDLKMSPELQKEGFNSQGEVLMDLRKASAALKATPLDRPEDCEINPKDGTLYIALTNNKRHGNLFGQIIRLVEKNDNHEALEFSFEILLAGGPQSGLACPDNLLFDRKGNLWVACDISSNSLHREAYQTFGNNGLFVVPTSGPSAGDAFQFASGPVQCELTGPCFTKNEDTLFLSVQHPGEQSKDPANPTSHWPEGDKSIPRPAVVAITGF